MIFQTINNVKTPAEKSILEELVSVYCKIVREVCHKNHMDYSPRDIELSEAILHELVDMGLIRENSQIKMLFKQIPTCAEFIYCVGFYIGN